MRKESPYIVAVFGAPEFEQRVLKRICALSASRANKYTLVDGTTADAADILLVDRHMQAARAQHEQFQRARGARPTVFISNDETNDCGYGVRRPLTATRMLGLLDHVVSEQLCSAPDAEAPATETASPKPERPSAETEARHGENPTCRALVVDDSLAVRQQVGLALKRSGIAADFASSGKDALELIARLDYDVIFLDVIMPGMDGYEVCRAIKRDKARKHIPVVMLTGKSSPFDKVKGKLSGCDSYLTKPVSLNEFKRTLTKCLSQQMAFESLAGIP